MIPISQARELKLKCVLTICPGSHRQEAVELGVCPGLSDSRPGLVLGRYYDEFKIPFSPKLSVIFAKTTNPTTQFLLKGTSSICTKLGKGGTFLATKIELYEKT